MNLITLKTVSNSPLFVSSVYIVTSGCYSDYSIRAVFSTRKDAKIFADAFTGGDHEIEEWPLDQQKLEKGMKGYFMRISKEGEVSDFHQEDSSYSFDTFCGYDIHDNMHVHVFGRNEEHAKKIGLERWAIVLGTCGWGKVPPLVS